MSRHDDNNDTRLSATNNADGTQSQVWERRLGRIIIATVLIQLLVVAILLTHLYVTYKPAIQLLGYISMIFSSAGSLTLTNAKKIAKLASTEQKRPSYIKTFTGAVLLYLSLFGVLFSIHKLEHGGWRYFYGITMLIGFILVPFSESVGKERRQLSITLDFISIVLIHLGYFWICIDTFEFN